jgi:hypothetical protein
VAGGAERACHPVARAPTALDDEDVEWSAHAPIIG